MAASNESAGPWKIAVFTMILPLGILGFAAYSGFQQAAAEKAAATAALSKEKEAAQTARNLDNGIQALKDVTGHNFEEINGGPNTVVGSIQRDLEQYGGSERQPTVTATLQAMAAKVERLESEVVSLEENIRRRDDRLREIEGAYEDRVQKAVKSQQNSESALQDKIRSSEEVIAGMEDRIRDLTDAFETAQIDKEELADTLEETIEEYDREIVNLRRQAKSLSSELRGLKNVSFEKADGLIRRVDAVQNICTINLGSADGLPPQTTFSVYKKNNAGIGRGLEDIKGSIEVTRILGPHLAEARILDQAMIDPISPRDPIYSPLWQEGRTEYFAFVGKIDIDRDGRDDRELLTRIVENANAQVELYIDDEAERVPANGRIQERTKFLVVGELPNPDDFANRDDKYDLAIRINAVNTELQEEALQYGKRVISLTDFLSYLGYKPTQRSYRPGEGNAFRLKSGQGKSTGQKARPLFDSLPKR